MGKNEPLSEELTTINPKKVLHDAKRQARKDAVKKEEKEAIEKQEKEVLTEDVHPKEFVNTLIKRTEINELINKLTNESNKANQQKLEHILNNIPENETLFKSACFGKIKEKIGLSLGKIEKLYNRLHKPQKVKTDTKKKRSSIKQQIDKLKLENPNFDYLQYDNKIIEITNTKINLLFLDRIIPNKFNSIIIGNFNLKIISKCKDHKKNTLSYTFTAIKDSFYNYPVMEFLKKYEEHIVKKTLGTEVIKFIFGERGKTVKTKKAKHIAGFKKGWQIPFENE